ncbi:NAD(P)-dependent dehydrogenase (short-subunit alcohol dehydrogenase family) [Rhodococcus sp. 27YEA15]|uniref:SDR family NAD(P)-dependent oxidoreductase n=1 Tax=Rhodococcus sp. 27YEA15 TaxID=3156259 RepID=UPI003C7A79EE
MNNTLRPADVPDFQARARLDGHRVVVLGGGAGMGRQTVHALTQLGALVACVDRDSASAETVATESGAIGLTCNAVDREDLLRCLKDARDRLGGPITGIVDIIGTAKIGTFRDLERDDWETLLDVNLRHALNLTTVIHELPELPSSIAVVGSISGVKSVVMQGAYGVVKAALHQLVVTLADELASQGVRVNAIAPGWTKTPRLVDKLGEEAWRTVDSEIPRGFAADPSEIAGPLVFLLSELSSYVTGQVIVVDGGLTNSQRYPRVF